jgi:hypothetical protein
MVCDIEITEATRVRVDGWKFFTSIEKSEWEAADWRIQSINYDWLKLAINIRITGRTIQYREGCAMVRCEIEWVGDGEPSEFAKGWILV